MEEDAMTTRREKIQAAKQHVAARLADIIEKNFDASGDALEAPGTFTALLEAHRACEIAEAAEPRKPNPMAERGMRMLGPS